MNLDNIVLISQSQKDSVWFHFYDTLNVSIIDRESRMVVARGWKEGKMRSYCLMRTESQFYKMKRVVEMDSGDDCTTL